MCKKIVILKPTNGGFNLIYFSDKYSFKFNGVLTNVSMGDC